MKAKIVYNKLLRGWYVVRGPHQTPLSGRFESKADAQAYLDRKRAPEPRYAEPKSNDGPARLALMLPPVGNRRIQ